MKKANMGSKAPMGTPDLKLTGSFHEKMFLRISGDEYLISSKDKKTADLVDRYDNAGDLFGISPNNTPQAQNLNTKKLAELLKQATGL